MCGDKNQYQSTSTVAERSVAPVFLLHAHGLDATTFHKTSQRDVVVQEVARDEDSIELTVQLVVVVWLVVVRVR